MAIELLVLAMLSGRLSDDNGFRSLKFGSSDVLAKPPMPACKAWPEPGIHWQCPTTIGSAQVYVAYVEIAGFFPAVMILGGSTESCHALFFAFESAWGQGARPDPLRYQEFWVDGDVSAVWTMSDSQDSCVTMIQNELVHKSATLKMGIDGAKDL